MIYQTKKLYKRINGRVERIEKPKFDKYEEPKLDDDLLFVDCDLRGLREVPQAEDELIDTEVPNES